MARLLLLVVPLLLVSCGHEDPQGDGVGIGSSGAKRLGLCVTSRRHGALRVALLCVENESRLVREPVRRAR